MYREAAEKNGGTNKNNFVYKVCAFFYGLIVLTFCSFLFFAFLYVSCTSHCIVCIMCYFLSE